MFTNWKLKYEVEIVRVKFLRNKIEYLEAQLETPEPSEPLYDPKDFYAPVTKEDVRVLLKLCKYDFIHAVTARDTTWITQGEIKPVRMYKLFMPEDYFHIPEFRGMLNNSGNNMEFEVGEVDWFLDADDELIIFARFEKEEEQCSE